MKKILILLLVLSITMGLLGCVFSSNIIEPVEFYYQTNSSPDSIPQQVIGSEVREATGHRNDLNYLLSLYLQGPLDPDLKSPFPPGCRLLSITWNGDTLVLTLNSTITSLDHMQRTIAGACIAKTCLSLTDIAQVQVKAAAPEQSDSMDMIITSDNLLLEDLPISAIEENP